MHFKMHVKDLTSNENLCFVAFWKLTSSVHISGEACIFVLVAMPDPSSAKKLSTALGILKYDLHWKSADCLTMQDKILLKKEFFLFKL